MKNLVLTLSVFCLVVSCQKKESFEKDAETFLNKEIVESSKGNVQLIKLKKTNGQEQNVFGVQVYSLEFEGEIKYNKDGWVDNGDITKTALIQNGFFGKKPYTYIQSNPTENEKIQNQLTEVKNGTTRQIAGTIDFNKKENGWEPNLVYTKIKN